MSDPAPLLMHQLAKTRKKPQVGDVFEVEFDAGRLAGRVIRTDALVHATALGLNLLYFYAGLRPHIDVDTMDLRIDRLLLPPLLTNNLGWSRGYFRTLGNRPLSPGEVLDVHCFDAYGAGYFDEYGRALPEPVEPVGTRGVHSYLTIEHEISGALGWGGTLHG